MKAHQSAIISKNAKIANDVEIGPNVFIDDNVEIENGVKIYANAYITGWTKVGEGTEIHMGAVVGHLPQDIGFDKSVKSFVTIGKNNVIREYATIHRSKIENGSTKIGNDNYFMAMAHIAHDCIIGNNVVICNASALGGHVEVEDRAFISANCVFHQYVRIGTLAMVQGLSGIGKDVPPYMMAEWRTLIANYNAVGLRRAGFSRDAINRIRNAYRLLYISGYSVPHALEEIEKMGDHPELKHLTEFIRSSKRGICPGRKQKEEEVNE